MTRFLLSAAMLVVAGGAIANDAAPEAATDDETAVVRLADLNEADAADTGVQVVRGQSPCTGADCAPSCSAPNCSAPTANGCCGCGKCASYGSHCGDPNCQNCGHCSSCGPKSKLACWLSAQGSLHRARNARNAAMLHSYARCKFGYFCPSANCGAGAPLVSKYGMVYSLDPSYADPRDADRYAASETGLHMNVPLAPNVRHTMNYSWGLPSSRLTPIRHGSVVGPPQQAYAHP